MISRNLNRHTTALAVFVIAGLVLLAANLGASDPIPGAPQSAPVAIVGATVHPIDGAPIDGATIVFNEGIIVAIGVVLFIIVGVIGFYGSEASNAPEGDIVNYEEPEVEG